jgi:hypothetical protein
MWISVNYTISIQCVQSLCIPTVWVQWVVNEPHRKYLHYNNNYNYINNTVWLTGANYSIYSFTEYNFLPSYSNYDLCFYCYSNEVKDFFPLDEGTHTATGCILLNLLISEQHRAQYGKFSLLSHILLSDNVLFCFVIVYHSLVEWLGRFVARLVTLDCFPF